jgi:outer membrane murein-binding lipoprotein Lpp
MERDIVERLREMSGPIVPNLVTDAAEAIERLRSRVGQLEADASALTAERDEARREACKFESKVDWDHGNTDPARFSPMALAAERGWDCFKDNGK